MSVRGVSGTSAVCPGPAWPAVGEAVRVVVAVVVPSLNVRVTVLVPVEV
jgi:hypothetical protein